LEEDKEGKKTGCLLYSAKSASHSGSDHFHYEVCHNGRGCSHAKVRVEVACSYFGRTLSEVDFLLLRSVVDQMATSIDSTIAQLGDLKALGDRFLPWNEQNEISGPLGESFNSTRKAQLLENDFQQWNRQLKSFCGDQVYSMDLLLNYVLAQLRMITKLSLMTETGL